MVRLPAGSWHVHAIWACYVLKSVPDAIIAHCVFWPPQPADWLLTCFAYGTDQAMPVDQPDRLH